MSAIRIITTREGKFAHIGDMRKLLKDDQYMNVNEKIAPLLVIGRDKGYSATEILRVIAGFVIFTTDKGE